MRTEKLILSISIGIFAVLVVIGVLTGSTAIAINLLFLGVLVLTFPYSAYKFLRFKKIRSYEKEFPNFLRDLAEAQRAGLTFVQAIQNVAKSEYGVLTAEIRKIENQLSWNVPIESVLKKFAERMSDSKIIVRSVMIIDQSNKSGGNIEETMDSLAGNIESLRDVQEEKSFLLNQQVLMMYAIFFIFLGITLALIRFLVPLLQTQGLTGALGTLSASTNPCTLCETSTDPACFGCAAFGSVAVGFDLGSQDDPGSYYKALFLSMILVQGIFTGFIAGQISSDSIVAGLKHSLVMLFSGVSIFVIVLKLGIV